MKKNKLIDKIVTNKIHESRYWKEFCFGLNERTLIERALELDHFGGSYGGTRVPTPFLCLILKMLEMDISIEISEMTIKNDEFKYLRALGLFYLRLIGEPKNIYLTLEEYYKDYRKLKKRVDNGWELLYLDEFVDQLLHRQLFCGVNLPFLPKRAVLEKSLDLPKRVSPLHQLINSELKKERPNKDESKKIRKEISKMKKKKKVEKWMPEKIKNKKKKKRKNKKHRSKKQKSSSSQGEQQKTELQREIEEQNALRKKLGLKPLRL
ncbi:pre-mRNA-splicing factor 38a [Anaeramoeba flamelloides]|uniref:Pre-mRNA-splicing factor 38 n=1 Tax=Anaeramoeba flamelloides TaxID=1746091 RepID=A0ABQ8YNS8_9EUKA|nr:pre-mRNA-splicing factor 38a [Anaeramoeba flamelloides]